MSRARNNRRSRSSQIPRPIDSGLKELNSTMKDLIVTTQTRSIPSLRDIQPMKRKKFQVHTFQVKVDKGNITANLTGTNGAFFFSLNDTPAPTDYTSLFDQYRIQQVQIEFMPSVQPFGPSTTTTDLPVLLTTIDYDDATAQSFATLQQSETAQVVSDQTYHQRTLTPRFAISGYGGVFGSFALAPVGSWVDSNSPAVQYYGVKWATSPVSVVSGTYVLYRCIATYTIQGRCNT